MNLKFWLLAFRPKTLTAAVIPILSAAALARFENYDVSIFLVLCCLGSALCIQIATNLFNDAIDFKKGADTNERLGPQRVTQSGVFSSRAVVMVAVLFLFFATLLAIPLVLTAGWPILVVGLVSLFLAYSYTGGPFPLAYLGLGDLFVFVFFGLIAVCGSYFLFTGSFSVPALVLGTQIGLLATVLIAINNLRDIYQDQKVSKNTLAVRLGEASAKVEILFLIVVTFLIQFYWVWKFQSGLFLLPLILFPLGVYILRGVFNNSPSLVYNRFLAWSAALHGGFGLCISLVYLLA